MIHVAIADDHRLIRNSMASLVNSFDGITVTLEAENGRDLLDELEINKPDVILLDLEMPIMDGFEACRIISERHKEIRILIVSQITTAEAIMTTVKTGANGYFTKNADPCLLESAIRNVHTSGFYYEPGLSEQLHSIMTFGKRESIANDPLITLTARELDIIKMVSVELTGIEIAEKLSINIRTVEFCRRQIIEKAGAKNFLGVVLMALKYKYIKLEDL